MESETKSEVQTIQPWEEEYVATAAALKKFSAALYQEVGKSVGVDENLFISPFSVAAVIAMAYVGSKENTAQQIKSALRIADIDDNKFNMVVGQLVQTIKGNENYTLEAANRMYVALNYSLLTAFQSTLKNHFGAEAQSVDFADDATRVGINNWVEEFTREKIKDLIKPGAVDGGTKLVLVNAIYFKGGWLEPFKDENTKKEPFYLGSKEKEIQVDMMHREDKMRSGDLPELDARILELPYKGHDLSMYIILPNKLDGLAELESKIESSDLLDTLGRGTTNAKLKVSIPKFKIESDLNLNHQLKAMGMEDMFNPGKSDLSGISGSGGLFVSDVVHKSFVQVNEEGSEAAAATAMMMRLGCCPNFNPPPPPPPFIADHPFLFLIQDDRNRVALFIGRVAVPKEN